MYQIDTINLGENGIYHFPENQDDNVWIYFFREYKGAIWKEGTSLDDDCLCLYIGENYKEHTTVIRNEEVYHAAALMDFLLTASQELVDVFNALLGLFRPDCSKKKKSLPGINASSSGKTTFSELLTQRLCQRKKCSSSISM